MVTPVNIDAVSWQCVEGRYDGEENCRYDKIIFQRRSDSAGDEAGCFGEREECCMNEMMMDLDPLVTAETWRKSGREVAIATVIETWGSAPRPAGSHLVIDSDANFEGSVSGGCVEGAVISEALDVISTGEAKMLEFGVADETAWRVGLSCGGRIRVYVERLG